MKQIRGMNDHMSQDLIDKVTGMHLVSVLPVPAESISIITSHLTLTQQFVGYYRSWRHCCYLWPRCIAGLNNIRPQSTK